jgi:hypothetical protein
MKKLIIALGLTLIMANCGGSSPTGNNDGIDSGGEIDGGSNGGQNDPGDNGDDLAELGELLEGLTQGKIEISNFQTYLQGTWNIKGFSKGDYANIESQISFNNGKINGLDIKPFFIFEEGTLLENLQKYYDYFEVKEELCKSKLAFDATSYIPIDSTETLYEQAFLGTIPQITYEFINTGFNPILKITATSTHYPTCCTEDASCQEGDWLNPEPYKRIRAYTVLAANENAFVVDVNSFYTVLTRQ